MKTDITQRYFAFVKLLLLTLFLHYPLSSTFGWSLKWGAGGTPPPEAPVLNAATGITDTEFSISWGVVTDATDYLVDVSTDNFATFIGIYNDLSTSNSTSILVSGLSPGTLYQYRVRATNVDGPSLYSATGTATTLATEPIDQPNNLVFSSIAADGFGVSFTAAAGTPNYLVLRRAGGAPTETPTDGVGYTIGDPLGISGTEVAYSGSATGFTESGLTASTTYFYSVFSFSGSGASANYFLTNPLTGSQLTKTLAPVLNAASSITQTTASITWSAVTGATGYNLDLSVSNTFSTFVLQANLGTVTNYNFSGLTLGTQYYVRLRAENGAGESVNSNVVNFFTIPATPTGLVASSITPTSFTLSWNSVIGATGFRVDLSTDPAFGSYTVQDAVSSGLTSHNFSSLPSDNVYYTRVRSSNSSGASPSSLSIPVIIPAVEPNAPPSGLSFTSITTNSFDVSFTAAAGSPSYLALRRLDTAPTETPVDGTGYTVGSTLGSSIIAYIGGATGFQQTVLSSGRVYHYAIFSFNGFGVTTNYLTSPKLTGSQITLSDAPVLNVATAVTESSASISWTAETGASNYELDVSTDNFTTFIGIYNSHLTGNVTASAITGLSPSTIYDVRVRTVNAAGQSANSNIRSFLTTPAAPTGLVVSSVTSSGFTLGWNADPGATGFFYDLSTNNFSSLIQSNQPTSGLTSHTFTGLSSSTTYQVRIRAANATGASPNSATASAATAPAGQPTNLVFSGISPSGFTVSFTAAAGSPQYLVLRREGSLPTEVPVDGVTYSIGAFGLSTIVSIGNSTSIAQSSLNAATTYFYSIFSFSGSGSLTNYLTTSPLQGSGSTNTAAPVLNAPSAVTQTSANISWILVPGATDYAMDVSINNFSGFESQNVLVGNVNNFTITGLASGTAHQVRVRAISVGGASVNSNVVSFTTIPATPINLAASAITSSGFTLTWSAVTGATSFRFDLSTDGFNTFVIEDTSTPGPTSRVFTGLAAATTFQVRLRSVNATGTSPSSTELEVTTYALQPTATPTNLLFNSITTSSFNATFTAAAGGPDYLVLRRVGSAPTEVPVDGTGYPVGSTFGSSTIVYDGSAAGFSQSGLAAGTTYFFAIFSFNGADLTANYRTTASLTGSQITLSNAPVLNAATAITQNSATLSWTAVTGASNYALDVSSDNFGTFVGTYNNLLTGNVTTFNISGLSPGISYSVRLRAVNAAGQSANSSVLSVLTIPPTPTGLATSAITSSGFTVNWNLVSGATGFFVDLSDDNFATLQENNLSVPGPTSYAFTGLSSGVNYQARLRSANSSGSSPNSSPVSASTLIVEPVDQPDNLAFSSVTSSGFNVTFTAAANDPNYVVFRRAGSAPTETPVDGVAYTAAAAVGSSGTVVAYIGSATSFAQSSLSAATLYYYAVFSFNGTGAFANYLITAPLQGSQTTLATEPGATPTSLSFNTVTTTSFNVSFTAAAGSPNYIAIRKEGSAPTETPADGTTYTVGATFGLSRIAYVGTATNFSESLLTPGSVYYYEIYSFSGSGSTTNYRTATLLAGNQATLCNAPNLDTPGVITQNSGTITWPAVPGATNYALDVATNNTFTVFVAGYQNLLVGNVLSTGISGLTAGTNYWIRLRAVNSAGQSANSGTETLLTIPPTPTGVATSSITSSGFTVTWNLIASATGIYLDLATDNTFSTIVQGDVLATGPTSHSFTGLTSGVTYYVRVWSFNASGQSPFSTSATASTLVTEPTAQPTGLTFTAITASSFNVSFTAAAGGPSYFVLRRAGSAPTETPIDGSAYSVGGTLGASVVAYIGSATGFSETSLAAGTVYHYAIFSFNGTGALTNYLTVAPLTGSQSTEAAPPVLNAPTLVTQTTGTITWTAVASATNYSLDVSTTNSFASFVTGFQDLLIGNVTTYQIAGLNPATQYFVRLTAINPGGESANSNTVNFLTIPATPTGLTVTAIAPTSFTLNWTAVAGASSFRVDLATDAGFTSLVVNNAVSANPTSHNFTGLANATTFYARVRSVNATGASPNSVALQASTLAAQPTAQPTLLTFNTLTASSFNASFTAAAGSPSYLVLMRGGSPPSEVPVDGTGYSVGSSIGVNGSSIAYSGTATTFSLTSLNAGTVYYFAIFSFMGSGVTANYLTPSPLMGSQITICAPPTLNDPTLITQNSATISWSVVTGVGPGAGGINYYALDVSSDNFTTYVPGYQNRSTGNVTSHNITGLSPGTTYVARLRAVNAAGQSVPSSSKIILTIPQTPSGLTTTLITASSFTLGWASVTNATGFYIDLSTDNFNTFVQTNLTVPTATSFSFTGLSSGVEYRARLQSYNASGTSPLSSVATVTTLTVEPLAQPTALVFSSISASGFTVSFTAAINNPRYFVLRRGGSMPTETPVDGVTYTAGNNYGTSSIAYIGPATSFLESGLTAATQYFYSIFAYNGVGALINYRIVSPLQGSQFTAPLAPVLQAPTSLTQTSGIISWAPVTGATNYALDVSLNNFSTLLTGYSNKLLGAVTSTTISGLTPGVTYQARLRAINTGGPSVNSNTVNLLTIPATPTGLVVSAISSSGFTLTWNAVSGQVDNFSADVSINGSVPIPGGDLPGPVSHTFTGLASSTEFRVWIRSVNASGESPNSVEVTLTTHALEPLEAPTLIGFNSVTTNSLNVVFTQAAGNPNYLVLRKASSAPLDLPQDGMSYSIGASIGSGTVAYMGGATGFSESGLTPGTTYHYAIFSFSGTGVTSNYLTSTILRGSQITKCAAPVLGAPNTIGQTSVKVEWPAVTGASDYGIDVATDATFAGMLPAYDDKRLGNVVSYNITQLNPGIEYFVRLRAYNLAGASVNSTSKRLITIPSTPSGLQVVETTTSGFTIQWDPISGFDEIRIDVSLYSDFHDLFQANFLVQNPTSYSINGLASGTPFYVRLRASNESGISANSATLQVSTKVITEPLKMLAPVFSSEMKNGGDVNLEIEVSGGSEPRTVTLHYKGITSAAFEPLSELTMPLTPNSAVRYSAKLTSAMADEMGIEFYITATDDSNVSIESDDHYFIYRSFDATASQTIPFNVPAFNGKASTFQMFSVPYELTDKTVAGIFDRVLGPPGDRTWRLFHYNGDRYDESPAGFTKVEVGKGYWFNTLKKDFLINANGGSVVHATSSQPFQMSLVQGWNQIGAPYPFNLDWEQIISANPNAGLNSLYGFENGAYIKKNVLGIWKGGFVFSDNGGTITFPFTSKTANAGRLSSKVASDIDEDSWVLPISLEAGGWTSESGIGMHPESKSSKDRFDEMAMPRFVQYLEMSTTHPEFFAPDFSTDVVPPTSNHQWEFRLNTNIKTEKGNLSWDMNSLAHANASLLLLDEDNRALINMKTVGTYSFDVRSGQTFRIVYRKEGEFKPGITALETAYPNPFNTHLSIPVYVTQDGSTVEVNVYDALGRKVVSLSEQFSVSGYYELTWDGKHSTGSAVENGMLYYRTVVDGRPGALKRLIKQSEQ
jgi:Fibronectin type III domain